MKDALYCSIRSSYSGIYQIVEVTSERGGRWYGRDASCLPTNGAIRDLVGKFDTIEEARAIVVAVTNVQREYSVGIAEAEKLLRKLQAEKRAAINELLKAA